MQSDVCQEVEQDSLESIRGDWEELLGRARPRAVFQTWEWQAAWWDQFSSGKKLRLLSARDSSGRVIGIAPFCIAREGTLISARVVRFLGTERVSSEYLDLVADPAEEERAAEALLDQLIAESSQWEVLSLTDLRHDSVVLRYWEPRLRSLGYRVERAPSQVCPYLPLPARIETLWRELGRSKRGALSRATRKLEACGYSYRAVGDVASLPDALDQLYDLHGRRWAARSRRGNFVDARVRRFHLALASTLGARNGVRIGMLTNGERAIAALYSLEWDGVVSFYQSGFEPRVPHASLRAWEYSPGLVLIGRSIEDAIARGCTEFDFLRGEEPYKGRWTPHRRVTWELTVIRPEAWATRGRSHLRGWMRASKWLVKRLIAGASRNPTEDHRVRHRGHR